MNMVIYFDGKEAIIKDPTSELYTAMASPLPCTTRTVITRGHNCTGIFVYPSQYVGSTAKLILMNKSITAVRFAVPISQENAQLHTAVDTQGSGF